MIIYVEYMYVCIYIYNYIYIILNKYIDVLSKRNLRFRDFPLGISHDSPRVRKVGPPAWKFAIQLLPLR